MELSFEDGASCSVNIMAKSNLDYLTKLFKDQFHILKQLLTPIEYAYHLNTINRYLIEHLRRKERNIKRKRLNNRTCSDVSSIRSRYLTLGEQDCSNFGSIFNSSSMPNRSTRSLFPQHRNNAHSSLYGNSGSNLFSQNINQQQSASQQFNVMEDTFPFGINNGKPYSKLPTQNGSHIEHSRTFQKVHPQGLKQTQIQSSFLKDAQNHFDESFVSSIQNNTPNCSLVPDNCTNAEDQYSCIRVGPISNKFHLSTIKENEFDSDIEGPNENELKNDMSVIEKNIKCETNNNEEKILNDWTVVLYEDCLRLKGTIMSKDNCINNYLTEEVLGKDRCGKVKTKDGCLWTLKGPFRINEDMPNSISKYFRNKKFPVIWRRVLKNWIEERKAGRERENLKSNLKPCKVILERSLALPTEITSSNKTSNTSHSSTNNIEFSAEKKKNSETTKNVFQKDPMNVQNTKQIHDKSKKKTIKVKADVHVNNNTKKSDIKSTLLTNSVKPINNKTKTKAVQMKTTSQVKKKGGTSKGKTSPIAKKKSPKGTPDHNKYEKISTKKKPSSQSSENSPMKNGNNIMEDLFGQLVSTPLSSDKLTHTPRGLLNSIHKEQRHAIIKGRYTPPLKQVGDFLENQKVKSNNNVTMPFIVESRPNRVAKRMAKSKGIKTNKKKKHVQEKNESSFEDNGNEIKDIMEALTDKTPQTTPIAIREAFRNEDDDIDSSNLNFNSDVSSIFGS